VVADGILAYAAGHGLRLAMSLVLGRLFSPLLPRWRWIRPARRRAVAAIVARLAGPITSGAALICANDAAPMGRCDADPQASEGVRAGGRFSARAAVIALLAATTIFGWCSPALAQWWNEPRPASRLDQRQVDPSGDTAARLKWDDGYIEVKAGATADKALAVNRAHERGMALDAARQLGYFKLAEVVEGVAIDGVTVVKNAMVVDQTVRSTVQARVRGGFVVSENVRDLSDGSVWAEVVLGLRLKGQGGLTESVAPWAASQPVARYQGDAGFKVNEAYTGLIVEASDSGFSPALAPRVIEEGTGKVVFGPHAVDVAVQSREGAVGYARGVAEARQTGRAGANPLIVRGLDATGGNKADIVLSRRDAERVLAADQAAGFLSRGAVVLVLGKERKELRDQPGKRHALVIGINDYHQAPAGAFPKLLYAVSDSQRVSAQLTKAGFPADGVTVLQDQAAARDKVIEALRSLRSRVKEEDSVVLYFSGHGSVGPGQGGRSHYYLVPPGGLLTDLAGTALADDVLEELVGQLPARQIVVILDTCYSGGASGTIRGRGVSALGAASRPSGPLIEKSAGRVVMSASLADQVAYEDDGRASGLFTAFLVDGLGGAADLDGDGAITVLELFHFVSGRVREHSRREFPTEQTPVLEVHSLSGDIVLSRRQGR
jgi:hypothetical protein